MPQAHSYFELDKWIDKWMKSPPIIATLHSKIVGFAEFEPNGHIDCFYVHHGFQGKGIGSFLINEIEFIAQENNINRIYAEVSITAKSFFESKGFKTLKRQTLEIRGQKLTNFAMVKITLRRFALNNHSKP